MEIVDKIGYLVDKLRETAAVTSITTVGTTHTIATADTGSVSAGDEIIIGGVTYTVVTVTHDTNFTVTATAAPVGTTWKAASPYYFHGTPTVVNVEFINSHKERGTFIFLFEVINEEIQRAEDYAGLTERTADLEMFFMQFCNAEDWTTDEHYSNVINTIATLVQQFETDCIDDSRVTIGGTSYLILNASDMNSLTKTNNADWGNFLRGKGFTDRILNNPFSGCSLSGNFAFTKLCPEP